MPYDNIHNFTTSQAILAQVMRNFKIQDASFLDDAVEWIGEAIQAIGYHTNFATVQEDLVVVNHKTKFPCELIELKDVFYRGAPLLQGYDTTKTLYIQRGNLTKTRSLTEVESTRLARLYEILEVRQAEYDANPTDDLNELIADIQNDITLITTSTEIPSGITSFSVLPYYNVIGRYIQTSFPSGVITALFKAYLLADDGYPLVKDTYKYRKAVEWYIIRATLLQGFKHTIISYDMADQSWDKFRYQAANEAKKTTRKRLQSNLNALHNPTRSNEQRDNFGLNAEQEQGLDY